MVGIICNYKRKMNNAFTLVSVQTQDCLDRRKPTHAEIASPWRHSNHARRPISGLRPQRVRSSPRNRLLAGLIAVMAFLPTVTAQAQAGTCLDTSSAAPIPASWSWRAARSLSHKTSWPCHSGSCAGVSRNDLTCFIVTLINTFLSLDENVISKVSGGSVELFRSKAADHQQW